MMFSVSETGKIEKLLSISITDLKGGDSMNKIKKNKREKGVNSKTAVRNDYGESVNCRHVGNGKKCAKGK